MSDKANVPTEAGWYHFTYTGDDMSVRWKRWESICVRVYAYGPTKGFVVDVPLVYSGGAIDEDIASVTGVDGTWGARIPYDAPLKAMREMAEASPVYFHSYAGVCGPYDEPHVCVYCGEDADGWDEATPFPHAPDCPHPRAQEDDL